MRQETKKQKALRENTKKTNTVYILLEAFTVNDAKINNFPHLITLKTTLTKVILTQFVTHALC